MIIFTFTDATVVPGFQATGVRLVFIAREGLARSAAGIPRPDAETGGPTGHRTMNLYKNLTTD